uniref:Uncharacterized protein n=1 Tax=Marseillevirus LCMAC202 TaxID=2506606 RepID=A0A481YY67_9VIRU|nr:MAG: hypothetical protein LCMAC202_05000 [Marseillevirus LCMAC202]
MGNEFSSCSATENILGDDDTQELTLEEVKAIEEQSDIFNCFYRHPTMENYIAIRSNDTIYQKALGNKYRVFVWAVRDTFTDLKEPLEENDALDYQLEVDRLLDLRNTLTAGDLDRLWTLYYATGDQRFPNRVKSVSNNELQPEVVRGAASWSYDSHIQQGLLEDPEWDPAGAGKDQQPDLEIIENKLCTEIVQAAARWKKQHQK